MKFLPLVTIYIHNQVHTCEVGWNRGPATPTLCQVCFFSYKGGLMLDIKRIRTDFDAVAEKLATRGVDATILNEMKEIDAKTS